MENQSPFLAMERVERLVKGLLRSVDSDMLEPTEKKVAASVRRLAIDARLDIRDYELSETRAEQLKCATVARKRVARLEATILATGSLFGPADVAQVSAQLQQVLARLV